MIAAQQQGCTLEVLDVPTETAADGDRQAAYWLWILYDRVGGDRLGHADTAGDAEAQGRAALRQAVAARPETIQKRRWSRDARGRRHAEAARENPHVA